MLRATKARTNGYVQFVQMAGPELYLTLQVKHHIILRWQGQTAVIVTTVLFLFCWSLYTHAIRDRSVDGRQNNSIEGWLCKKYGSNFHRMFNASMGEEGSLGSSEVMSHSCPTGAEGFQSSSQQWEGRHFRQRILHGTNRI